MKRRLLALVLLTLLVLTGVAARPAQVTDITYERYDVDITLNPEGTFTVRERQQIRFDGEYHNGFAEIPTAYTTGLEDLQLLEEDQPYVRDGSGPGSFTVSREGDSLYVEWEFTPTRPGDVRTFVIQYDVKGGLWVYPDQTVLEWRAVPADRSGIPVEASQVKVTLPQAVAPEALHYTAYGPEFTARVTEDSVTFEAGAIPDGTAFQVQVGFPAGIVAAQAQAWQREEEQAQLQYRLTGFDVELALGADGMLTVDEYQSVAVDAGALYNGNRSISLLYLDKVSGVALWEGDQAFTQQAGGCDYCFTLQESPRLPGWVQYDTGTHDLKINEDYAGKVDVTWTVPALVKGESTTFQLHYQVEGAVRVQPDKQQLNWTAVYAGRDVPVEAARVLLHLPASVNPAQVQIEGGTVKQQSDGVLITHAGPVPANTPWEIKVTLPAGALAVNPPSWQQIMENTLRDGQTAAARKARLQLGLGVLSLLIFFGGLGWVLGLWFLWGRDQKVALPAEYLKTPPSPLPPGIVAYLLDEKATLKGALASLFHLATLGLLQINFTNGQLTLQRNSDETLTPGETLQTPEGETLAVPKHLVTLYNAVQPAIPRTTAVPLGTVAPAFHRILPQVYTEMGVEATEFFSMLPEKSRQLWTTLGAVIAGVGVLACCLLSFMLSAGIVASLPGLALGITGVALIIISRWMPQKSSKGAREAAYWQAFKRFLQNLKQYGNLEEAQTVLDRYFAYAVALDVEEAVLKQAETLGASMPIWVLPAEVVREGQWMRLRRARRMLPASSLGSGVGQAVSGGLPQVSGVGEALSGAAETLSLQGLSDQLARSINNASNGLSQLLTTATSGGSDTMRTLGRILDESSSGGGSGGFSGSSSRSSWSSSGSRSSWSSSSSRSSFSRSSSSRSSFGGGHRSSGSRSSGGGGRRGFR